MRIVCDIEANALHNPDKIWVICAKDIDTNATYEFRYGTNLEDFPLFATGITQWIGHNFIDYDAPVISRVLGVAIPEERITDTLVLSRLMNYNLEGGHSLENYGRRLGFPKQDFSDWSTLTDTMVEYCHNDVELNHRVYQAIMKFLDRPEFVDAIKVEHQIAHVCRQMRSDGFRFDASRARELLGEVEGSIAEIDKLLQGLPPKARPVREYNPRLTKHGTISKSSIPRGWQDLSTLSADSPFTLIEWEPFNPGSVRQVVERLNDAGWRPVDKTKGHIEALKDKKKSQEKIDHLKKFGWKVNEVNISTLPEDAPDGIKGLVRRLLLEGRRRTLTEWLENYNDVSGRVHPTFNHIGTWTHRMSHVRPNLGNVAAPKSIKYKAKELADLAIRYGGEMRALWKVDEGNFLVGTDAEGIQLRIFAHYIDEPEFTKALIEGKKEDGTDPHTLNGKILGCSRDDAKTFIYAFLLGAGDQKIGEILKRSTRDGGLAKTLFIEHYPGLARLRRDVIPRDAARGFFQGFDGRLVRCDSEHLMLAGYLQNGEACIMKHANLIWRQKLLDYGIEYKQVNFVHDEWQTEVRGCRAIAGVVGRTKSDAIREVGERFGLKCPMAGQYNVGRNWQETH